MILMEQTDIELIRNVALSKLNGLSQELTYHNIDHTLDVVWHCERIAIDEAIEEKDRYLLNIAALYHDTGFLEIYTGHELKSCDFFLMDAGQFNLSETDISTITDLIMSTRVPQKPLTLLQKIICDADLDYLGRDDFDRIGEKLKQEFIQYGFVDNEAEWKKLQITFLDNHQYHTNSSRCLREPVKRENYKSLL